MELVVRFWSCSFLIMTFKNLPSFSLFWCILCGTVSSGTVSWLLSGLSLPPFCPSYFFSEQNRLDWSASRLSIFFLLLDPAVASHRWWGAFSVPSVPAFCWLLGLVLRISVWGSVTSIILLFFNSRKWTVPSHLREKSPLSLQIPNRVHLFQFFLTF